MQTLRSELPRKRGFDPVHPGPRCAKENSLKTLLFRELHSYRKLGFEQVRHSILLARELAECMVRRLTAREKLVDEESLLRKTEREIAEALNGRGIFGEYERPWTRSTVHQVLTNPKYIGANIYNRRSFKLKHKRINNPVQMWIWRDGAFAPIVDAAIFEQARHIIELRHHHLSDKNLLERLKELLRLRGRLSGLLI